MMARSPKDFESKIDYREVIRQSTDVQTVTSRAFNSSCIVAH